MPFLCHDVRRGMWKLEKFLAKGVPREDDPKRRRRIKDNLEFYSVVRQWLDDEEREYRKALKEKKKAEKETAPTPTG